MSFNQLTMNQDTTNIETLIVTDGNGRMLFRTAKPIEPEVVGVDKKTRVIGGTALVTACAFVQSCDSMSETNIGLYAGLLATLFFISDILKPVYKIVRKEIYNSDKYPSFSR